jgi:hypothetical protein
MLKGSVRLHVRILFFGKLDTATTFVLLTRLYGETKEAIITPAGTETPTHCNSGTEPADFYTSAHTLNLDWFHEPANDSMVADAKHLTLCLDNPTPMQNYVGFDEISIESKSSHTSCHYITLRSQ